MSIIFCWCRCASQHCLLHCTILRDLLSSGFLVWLVQWMPSHSCKELQLCLNLRLEQNIEQHVWHLDVCDVLMHLSSKETFHFCRHLQIRVVISSKTASSCPEWLPERSVELTPVNLRMWASCC
jgi:hypothetical protein